MSPVHLPLSETEFIAFDLETTGLTPERSRIIEFGAVRFRLDGTESGRLEQLVDPQCPIPFRATCVHGINDAMVHGMPTVAEMLPVFLEFLGGAETVLLAHNARFDVGFLHHALRRAGVGPPPHPVIDTLQLARRRIRGLNSYRLETLAIHLRIAEGEDHRALSDAHLVKGAFLDLVGRQPHIETVADLFRCTRPMRFAAKCRA